MVGGVTSLKRESGGVVNTLFRFVKQAASLAQNLSDAALLEISHPAGNRRGVASFV